MWSILWTGLISTRGLRKTNNKGNVKRMLSLRRGGISSQINSIIIDLGGISLNSQGLPTPKQLMQCSKNRCIRFWRRLRTSRSSNGRTRWLETPWGTTKTFIANTIKIRDTLWRIAWICGTIWTSWSEKGSWSSCCTILVVKQSR